ncbi:MAG: spermidine synthase [Chloroflexi bacterium]|nr:spermidine synthase [Chloroflexota bacterium]
MTVAPTLAAVLARPPVRLFLTSFAVLFVELLLIRWIPAYAVFVGFFSNFILMASFLGIGLGILLGPRLERLSATWLAFLLLATVIVVVFGQLSLKVIGPEQIFFGLDDARGGRLNFLVLPFVALLTVAFMAILAAPLGALFRSMPPLKAYAIDISGSICGIAAFTALSASGSDPILWFAVAGVLIALMTVGRGVRLRPSPALLAIALVFGVLGAERFITGDQWSPYYRITVRDSSQRYAFGGLVDKPGAPRGILVSGIGHQSMFPVSESVENALYGQIYRWYPDKLFERVLVIGAGSGTDVALALAKGADRVVAVEIDPVIARIGEQYHPDQPYSDPRVERVIEDGRAYLARSTEKFDLIIFALTDSLTLVTGTANVRLESFLFTEESFALANDHLADDGAFVMYNTYRQLWLIQKLSSMAETAFGPPPLVHLTGASSAVMATGPLIAAHGGAPAAGEVDVVEDDGGPTPRVSTDDWPFLYLRFEAIPNYYFAGLAFLVLLGLGGLAWAGRTGTASIRRFSPHFFALGAAFLLLETRSLVTFSLLFGTTWLVNALAFAAILISVLLSIALASRMRNVPKAPLYALLAASILVAWALPPERLFLDPPALRYVVASALAFAPVFFANLVFSRSFGDTGQADVAFASNLLGAMVGGALEYLSLLTGFRMLGLVALGLYGLAWLFERRLRWLGDRVTATPGAADSAVEPVFAERA